MVKAQVLWARRAAVENEDPSRHDCSSIHLPHFTPLTRWALAITSVCNGRSQGLRVSKRVSKNERAVPAYNGLFRLPFSFPSIPFSPLPRTHFKLSHVAGLFIFMKVIPCFHNPSILLLGIVIWATPLSLCLEYFMNITAFFTYVMSEHMMARAVVNNPMWHITILHTHKHWKKKNL